MNADGTGYLAQRVMACRSDRDAKIAAVVFTVAQILLRSLLWLPIGLGLLVLFPPDLASSGMVAAEREATFVRGIVELLPSGLRGLLLAALLAALASTLDTHLNWGASYVANDLYKRFYCEILRRRPARETTVVWVARVSNLLILGIALGIMTRLSSIQVAWQLSLLLGAGMGVPLVLRWLWWRINAWGEIGAIAASLALAPFLLAYVPAEREALRLLLMALASTGAGIAASLLTAPEPLAGLRAFYERVGPPGFWGPVGSPGDAGRLWRGLAATGLAALSIFALLTGAGSWLVRSPAPTWFPSQPAFVACLLVTGAALVPVWWRLGFSARRR
jgi:Na+/proline symporter